jgi:exodeoxyribonuclease VII large subunit
MLAHQLTQLDTPVISAVGHETDESISDLVADLSCITPTAAANLISGDFNQLQQNLIHNSRLLTLLVQDKFRVFQQKLDATVHQLDKSHPNNTLNQQQQALNNLKQNLKRTINNYWQHKKSLQQQLCKEFIKNKPQISLSKNQLNQTTQQLNWLIHHQIDTAKQKLGLKANDLNHQNPLAVLNRGYSITTKLSDGSIISDTNQVKVGDMVSSQLKSGKIHAKIFERLEDKPL